MKKFLFFCAALLVAMTASAKIWEVSPTHCETEGDQANCNIYRTLKPDYSFAAGDTLLLAGGNYDESLTISLTKDIVVMAKEGEYPVIILTGYFELYATAKFIGVKFDHSTVTSNGYGFYVRENTSKSLTLEGCEFVGFDKYCVTGSQSSGHCDAVFANNCYFHDCNNGPFYFPNSSLADGVNMCNHLEVTNSTFANINVQGWVSAIDLLNNNNSTEATSKLIVDHCTFYNCQGDYERLIQSYKSPDAHISNCIMMNPVVEGKTEIYATYLYGGEIHHNLNYQTKRQYGSGVTVTDSLQRDPQFVDAANGNYFLKPTSPAMGAASDGTNLGDPRWWPTVKFKGAWDGWTEHNADFATDYSKASVTINMSAGTDIEFGVMINEVFRANGYNYHRGFTGAAGITGNTSNMTLQADMSGDYKFEWYFANDSMAIIFPEPTLANGYYLVGKFNGVEAWGVADLSADKMLVKNTEALGDEYMISDVALVAGDQLKVAKVEWDAIKEYLPAESNYTVDADHQGTKIIYFRPNKDGGSDWFYNTIYIEANGGGSAIDNTEASMKAVKMIENGQLYIIKNGVKFNAIGEVVK